MSLGAPFLLGLGAAGICDLDTASCEDSQLPLMLGKRIQTLVIAVTRLLTEAHPLILKAVLVGRWCQVWGGYAVLVGWSCQVLTGLPAPFSFLTCFWRTHLARFGHGGVCKCDHVTHSLTAHTHTHTHTLTPPMCCCHTPRPTPPSVVCSSCAPSRTMLTHARLALSSGSRLTRSTARCWLRCVCVCRGRSVCVCARARVAVCMSVCVCVSVCDSVHVCVLSSGVKMLAGVSE